MKNLFIAFLVLISFSLSAQKRVSFECFDCQRIEQKDCEICKTSSVNKMYLNGILVRFDNAKPVPLHKPFKVWTKGRNVYVKDFEGTEVRIPVNKTTYNKLSDLVDAVLDCNCSGGGGGFEDTNTTYLFGEPEIVDGVTTYTVVDSDDNEQELVFEDTQLSPADVCQAVADNCNSALGEVTYSLDVDGNSVAEFTFTDNTGQTFTRTIVFPSIQDQTGEFIPVVLNGDTIGYNYAVSGSNGETFTEGFTFPIQECCPETITSLLVTGDSIFYTDENGVTVGYELGSGGTMSSVTKVTDADGAVTVTHDDGNGGTENFCVGAKIEDHEGDVINLDCTNTLFNEDIVFDDTNVNSTGIGISGAEYSHAAINAESTETNRGVQVSNNSNATGVFSLVRAGNNATASGTRTVAGGNGSTVSGVDGMGHGRNITISGARSAGFGEATTAAGQESFVANRRNESLAFASSTFGTENINNIDNGTLTGLQNTGTGANSLGAGVTNNWSGNANIGAGSNNVTAAGTSNNMVVGNNNNTTGSASRNSLSGVSNTVGGNDNLVGGQGATVPAGADKNIVGGQTANVQGTLNLLFGDSPTINLSSASGVGGFNNLIEDGNNGSFVMGSENKLRNGGIYNTILSSLNSETAAGEQRLTGLGLLNYNMNAGRNGLVYVHELAIVNLPEFASDAAADAALPAGHNICYKLTGNRTVFVRP